jgi:diguanylate cyclase (GGDEF)-like protein
VRPLVIGSVGAEDTPARRRQVSRVGGKLLTGGAVVALIDALVPPISPLSLIAVATCALALGLGIIAGIADRVSPQATIAGVMGLQALLAGAYFVNGEVYNVMGGFFVWMVPYVAFFFGRGVTVRLVVWTGLLLAAALVGISAGPWKEFLDWLGTMGLMVTVAVFVIWSTELLRASEAAANATARRDPLTGLGNRDFWTARVAEAISAQRRDGGRLVVLLVDLDDFKGVNDTFGHPAGDALLVEVAPRLVSVLRPTDSVARLGGDEFAILAHDRTGELDPDLLAARVLEVINLPYGLGNGERAYTSASIGVVVADSPTSAHVLLRDADVAMYEAKARGRSRFVRFDAAMALAAADSHELLTALRHALPDGQCSLVFQPVYAIDSLEMIGAEALLRWNHPQFGAVPPDRFIPLAESSGLVGQLTDFVLDAAVASLAGWRATGAVSDRFTVSVNVSVRDLRPGLADRVLAVLDRADVPHRCLTVEVTETAVLDAFAAAEELTALRAAGVWVVLDDFGSGFSSLSYLERLPLDGIKIDRAFLPTRDAPRRWEVVGAILEMARALGLHVVAEGVETLEQATMLHHLGCRWVQGYLYSRPVAADCVGPADPDVPALGPFPESVARSMASSRHERGVRPVPSAATGGGVELLPVARAELDRTAHRAVPAVIC